MQADFWWVLTIVCLVWYSTITVYIAIRGAWDIKSMLARLQTLKTDQDVEDQLSSAERDA